MQPQEILDVLREAMVVTLQISGPLMLVALVVGLIIGLFQALTQIQEITLTFVPKIIAVFVSLILFAPFIMATLISYAQGIADRIISIGIQG